MATKKKPVRQGHEKPADGKHRDLGENKGVSGNQDNKSGYGGSPSTKGSDRT